MQTWLVHMRNPAALWRDLGWRSFLVFQVLFTGMIASALVHPFFVCTLLWLAGSALLGNEPATYHSALISVDIVNILLGYLGFLMLGRQTLAPPERKGFWRVALFTPVYWIMMSVAAWRAVGQLFARPHEWEKTPHRPRRRSVAAKRHQPDARNSDPSRMMSGSSRPIAASSLPA
ncbi:MAG: hypothetical protein K5872_06665 [Rhizobiaceae bacterium]|nr:hypothetical protein [Rhizobiaceae bacterium]MCV0405895.1 hypothetical protein [Rhizobiaceae bacterium]